MESYRDPITQCTEMIRKGSSTFYQAFGFLPSPRQEAVFVVYAFCRLIDDAVDEPEFSPLTIYELEEGLLQLESADGHFIWPALRWLFREFPNVRTEPFLKLMEGQRQDLLHIPFESFEQLENYCYLVAGTVGEMLLPILHDHPTEWELTAAIQMGKAMQIVNIIRDVGEDLARGRRYIPTYLLDLHGYKLEQLEAGVVNAEWVSLVEELGALAAYWMRQGSAALATYPRNSAFCMELASQGYMAILDVVRHNRYDVFGQRAVVKDSVKHSLLRAVQTKYRQYAPNAKAVSL